MNDGASSLPLGGGRSGAFYFLFHNFHTFVGGSHNIYTADSEVYAFGGIAGYAGVDEGAGDVVDTPLFAGSKTAYV